jgi:pRiA4b ORF-3-like protein/transposase IS66 family protein
VNDLIEWMKRERGKLSRHNEVAKAMDYMLKRIDVFTRFLEDGRICLSNNAAERELRGIALVRKSWLFAGCHLYEIRADGVRWSMPYPDQDWAGDFLDARKARLRDVLEDVGTKTLKYLYDFGDGWEHTIKVERLIDPEPGILYPCLIEAKGRCPQEDVGGPWGHGEFLEAIADPKHERHRELKEWFADDFDPHVVDVDWLSEDAPNWLSAGRANPSS